MDGDLLHFTVRLEKRESDLPQAIAFIHRSLFPATNETPPSRVFRFDKRRSAGFSYWLSSSRSADCLLKWSHQLGSQKEHSAGWHSASFSFAYWLSSGCGADLKNFVRNKDNLLVTLVMMVR